MTPSISIHTSMSLVVGSIIILGSILSMGFASLASAEVLSRQLEVGSDVSLLQTFLAKDITIYPQGIVSGYFGFLTKAAVSNFQSRNGLPAVGRVGPQTLPVINAQMAGGVVSNTGSAALISSVSVQAGNNSVFVNWNTNEMTRGVVYYSATPISTFDNIASVTVSGNAVMTDSNMRASHSVGISNLASSTTYYYSIYVTDQDGNVSLTWPSTFQTKI